MAIVGQPLISPEVDWVRFDDTDSNISYIGTWADGTGANYYNSTRKMCNILNNSIKFNFIGTKIRIIGNCYNNRSNNITIKIDGNSEIFSMYSEIEYIGTSYLCYEKTELENREHYVEIINNTTDWIIFDAVDIDKNGILKPYGISKYLIQNKNNNSLYKIDGRVVDLATTTTTEELFKTQGSDIPPTLTEDILNQIGSCKLLKWTDSGEIEHTLNMQGNYKDKLFKLIDGCKILTWTDNNSANECELICSHNPIRLMDNPQDYKLKMWTDDANIIDPRLTYECEKYRPIDRLSNQFNILEYKE